MRPFKNTRPSVSPLRQLLVSGLSTDAHGHKPDTEIYTVKLPDGRSIHTFRLSTAFTGSKEAIGSEKQHVKSPIVLIHGFAAGLGLWFQLLPYLALTGRDVYALDLPGVGSSSDIDQDTLHSFRGQSRGSKCTNVCCNMFSYDRY
jgi:pimeloyl-ACP methyl ester carboxylesterase